MPKNITQKVTFDAKPHDVFELLMDEKKHSAFTGEKASVSRKAGGMTSAWGGYLIAMNVEITKDKRIVQAWRSAEWAKGEWSIVTYALAPAAGGKTTLTFTQYGIPDSDAKEIAAGWKLYYWKPMAAYLAGKRG